MERILVLITMLVSLLSHAQSDVPPILTTDPWRSNGYFIVDEAVRIQRGIAYIEVEVSVSQYQPNGSYTREVAETFQIVPPAFYDHADPDLPSTLDDGERVFYHITAFDANHEIVDEWDSIGDGDEIWPEICRETCNAAAYAWTLVGYSDGGQTLVELHEATQNGSYFYVKEADWPHQDRSPAPS